MTISIKGLEKGDVLAALFNGTQPLGMGFLQAGNGPKTMTKADADKVIAERYQDNKPPAGAIVSKSREEGMYYDYLFGRPLKVDISGDELDGRLFDRDSHTTAAECIRRLRERVGVEQA